jgi:hypothetical protein
MAKTDAADAELKGFEARFHAAARRVLARHGVPEARIEDEIARLRRLAPGFTLPTVDELERLLSERANRT